MSGKIPVKEFNQFQNVIQVLDINKDGFVDDGDKVRVLKEKHGFKMGGKPRYDHPGFQRLRTSYLLESGAFSKVAAKLYEPEIRMIKLNQFFSYDYPRCQALSTLSKNADVQTSGHLMNPWARIDCAQMAVEYRAEHPDFKVGFLEWVGAKMNAPVKDSE